MAGLPGFLTRRLGDLLSDKMMRRFLGSAGSVMLLRLASGIVRYLVLILLARWLTQEAYGYYGFLLNLTIFLSMVCSLGLSVGTVRFIGQYSGREDDPASAALIKGVAWRATGLVFVCGVAVFAIASIGVLVAWSQGAIDQPFIYIAGLALLPAYALADVQASALRAFDKVASAIIPRDLLWRLLAVPIAYGITRLLPEEYHLIVFLVVFAATLWAIVAWQRYILWKAMPEEVRRPPARSDWPVWRRAWLPMWITSIARTTMQSLDVVIVGFLLSPVDTALYFAASRTASQITFFLASSNLVVGPEVARLYHAGRIEELQRILRVGATLVFAPSLAIFLVVVIGCQYVMALFGPDFVAAWPVLVILAAGQLVNAATGCVSIALSLTGHERENAKVVITNSILTVIMIFALTPLLGIIGTAIATSTGTTLWNLRLWMCARRRAGIDPSILSLFSRMRPSNGKA